MGEFEEVLGDMKIVEAVYAKYKEIGDKEPQRKYLGMSSIGHPCDRYQWYLFRNCVKPEFDGRMLMLFDTGKLEEERFVKELRLIGAEVHDKDGKGEQFGFSDVGGHFKGHIDGVGRGIPGHEKKWHILEFKTHNNNSFKKLEKEKVRLSKPEHYSQMQIYMHYAKLERALYYAKNKDTDQRYAERVRYDNAFALRLVKKAESIIRSQDAPERLMNNEVCKYCPAKELCMANQSSNPIVPIRSLNCRQCEFCSPLIDDNYDGCWLCSKKDCVITNEEQSVPCEYFSFLPDLLKHIGSKSVIEKVLKNSSPSELIVASLKITNDEQIIDAKKALKARIVKEETDLEEKYRVSKVLWTGTREELDVILSKGFTKVSEMETSDYDIFEGIVEGFDDTVCVFKSKSKNQDMFPSDIRI